MVTQLVDEGTLTLREVGERFGVSKWSVRRYLKRFGIEAHVVHANGRPEARLKAADVERLARLLEVAVDPEEGRAEVTHGDADTAIAADDTAEDAAGAPAAGGRENRQLVLRGVTRQELRDLLVDAFTEALRNAQASAPAAPAAPRRFQETRAGKILTAALYALVFVMAVASLAFAVAIARKFELLRVLAG